MHFLRKLKNFKLKSSRLYLLFQSVVQSIMLYNQICYFTNARKADMERLDCITAAARKITRHELQSPTAICQEASLCKFMKILSDSTQPLYPVLSSCASRHKSAMQFILIKSWMNRFKNSFLPMAIRLFNATDRSSITRQP